MLKYLFFKKTAGVIIAIFLIILVFTPTLSSSFPESENKKITKQDKKIKINDDYDDVLVTCYNFGLPGDSSKKILMSHSEALCLYEKINKLNFAVTDDPFSYSCQQLQDEILGLAEINNLLPDGLSKNMVKDNLDHAFSHNNLGRRVLPKTQSKASEFLCSFVSTGSGSALPVIALPRLIPILMIPIPRLFMIWRAEEGFTSCGGLRSGTGFISAGHQNGVAIGFWGLGFTFSLPPLMGVYGLLGYSLYAHVDADEIDFYPPNNPPDVSQIDPGDGEIDVPLTLSELRFQISDYDGELMSYIVTTNPDIGSGNGNLKTDGVYSIPVSGLEGLTDYTWHVEVTDGMDTTIKDFLFTTEAIAPIISNPSPENGEKYVPVSLSYLSFHLKDYQDDLMDYTVETVPGIGSGSGNGVNEGTYSVPIYGLDYTTEYIWYINVTDGEHETHKVFNFQTEHEMTFDPFTKDWLYRKEIVIDHTKVVEELENFPVLISIVDVDLCDKAQFDGDDILFMDDVGVASRLFHEIEFYDGSTGELVAWVNLGFVDSDMDTVFYLYYGNPNCGCQEASELVWDSGFEAVWHMDDGSNLEIHDSTFNGNIGLKKSIGNPFETPVGKIGFAQDFERDNNAYINAHGTYSIGEDDDITLSAWINIETHSTNNLNVIMSTMEGSIGNYVSLRIMEQENPNNGKKGYFTCDDTIPPSHNIFTDNILLTNNWCYICGIIDRTNGYMSVYKDGVQQTDILDISSVGSCDDGFSVFLIGVEDPDYGLRGFYDGILDELRVSNEPRTSGWILTEYNNQNNPSSFLNIGSEEQL